LPQVDEAHVFSNPFESVRVGGCQGDSTTTMSAAIAPPMIQPRPVPGRASVSITSGRVRMMKATAATVINASPMPINAWTLIIAGITMSSGIVPLNQSCREVASAAPITESHAATPMTAS